MHFTEKFLYHIWDAQHIMKNLKTISGKPVSVMFQGRWNTDEGPDFKESILNLNGKVIRGDIEIHRKSYDWIIHKHSENKKFNNVILHVVYEHNSKYTHTINENGDKIEIMELQNFLNEDITKLLKIYSDEKFKQSDKFCDFFAGLDIETTKLILSNFGKKRLEKKIKRFTAELYFTDFDQLLYQGIFEALGYSKNKFQMLQLALKYPYTRFKEYFYKGMTKDELISILLCGTGLINHLPVSFPIEFKNKWQEIYSKQKFNKEILDIDWSLFRIRPINHPAIRILQAANFIYESLKDSYFYDIVRLFSFPRETFNKINFKNKIYSFFQSKSEYLPEKYTLGMTRIDTILINIVLPLVILYAQKMKYNDLKKAAMKVYQEFHGLPENYITTHMKNFMDTSQRKLIKKKAIYQQGLLKLYYDYCIHHSCAGCDNLKKDIVKEM